VTEQRQRQGGEGRQGGNPSDAHPIHHVGHHAKAGGEGGLPHCFFIARAHACDEGECAQNPIATRTSV
jgi:hypothetical protein